MHVVVTGNVAEDRGPGGAWIPGGPSLYSARTALALGARVTLISNLHDGYQRDALEGLAIVSPGASGAPRYANEYDERGGRRQLLLDEGSRLVLHGVDVAALGLVDALMVAPAYHEISILPRIAARVTGVALQGLLRTRDADHRVRPHPVPRAQVEPFIAPGAFAFFSEEDTTDPRGLAAWLAAKGMTAVLTCGARGALLFEAKDETPTELPAFEASLVEPTGAGDVFAMAFLVRMAETGDVHEASRFAAAAGSVSVEASGLAGIPTREAVEARLGKVAA